MKSLLLLAFFTVPLWLAAQNWSLFNSHDRYNFKEQGAPLITNVLFADSFQVDGTDTLYFTNKIVSLSGNYVGDTVYKNSAQFLHSVIRLSPGGVFSFYDDSFPDFYNKDTFVIQSLADSGKTWLYDSTANITATIQQITIQNIFGQTDSVKHIKLSNGDSILLSQSFGLIAYPADTIADSVHQTNYFTLQGIETRGLGDSLINFWSVFNFNVGDVFYYQDEGGDAAGPDYGDGYWIYTVTGKSVFPDSIQYKIKEYRFYEYYSSFYNTTTYNEFRDSAILTFCDSLNHLANTYPGQNLSTVSQMYYPPTMYLPPCFNCGETYSTYFTHPYFPVLCKAELTSYSYSNGNLLTVTDTNGYEGSGEQGTCMVCAGLGLVASGWGAFEVGVDEQLVGYIKNGLTFGTILAIPEIDSTISRIQVYPNLVKDHFIALISDIGETGKLTLTLYDLLGQQLANYPLNTSRNTINCPNLASALYVWRVTDAKENMVASGKLIKR